MKNAIIQRIVILFFIKSTYLKDLSTRFYIIIKGICLILRNMLKVYDKLNIIQPCYVCEIVRKSLVRIDRCIVFYLKLIFIDIDFLNNKSIR